MIPTLDAIRPYFLFIRLMIYAIVAVILFASGCSHGKQKSEARIADLKAQVQGYESAHKANLDAIDSLKSANEAFAKQSAEQGKKAAQAVEQAKRAQADTEAELRKTKKELSNAYKRNQEWSDTAVPADIVGLLK